MREDMQRALTELHLRPLGDTVTSTEAAQLLTWRAQEEYDTTRQYTPAAIRRWACTGHLVPLRQSKRCNRYRVEDIFSLPLVPRRGRGRGQDRHRAA